MAETNRFHVTARELDRFATNAPELVAYTHRLRALLGEAYDYIQTGPYGTYPLDVEWEVYSTRWEGRVDACRG